MAVTFLYLMETTFQPFPGQTLRGLCVCQ